MATLHRIRVDEDSQPKAYHLQVGDVAQCYLDYAVTPGTCVSGLEVALEGKSLRVIGVAATTRPDVMGSAQLSAFLYAVEAGLGKARVKSIVEGGPGAEYLIPVLVS